MHNQQSNRSQHTVRGGAIRARRYDTYHERPIRSAKLLSDVAIPGDTLSTNSSRVPGPVSTPAQSKAKPSKHAGHHHNHSISKERLLALRAVAHTRIDNLPSGSPIHSVFPEHKPARHPKQKVFYGLGLVVMVLALFASLQTFMVNQQAIEELGVLGAQSSSTDAPSGSNPEETPVPQADVEAYSVASHLPRAIRIEDIGVYARIKHTGLDSVGAVDAPANIFDASWYNGSKLPGSDHGASLILGHVSGWTAPGVFKKIDKLSNGSQIEVEKGSGEKLVYEVFKTEKIPVEELDMTSILKSDEQGRHELRLMTCAGRYDRENDHYEDRFVVYAKILK